MSWLGTGTTTFPQTLPATALALLALAVCVGLGRVVALRLGGWLGAVPRATTWALAVFLPLAWVQAGGMLLGFTHLLHPAPAAGWLVLGAGLAVAVARRLPAAVPEPGPMPTLPLAVGLALTTLLLLLALPPPWYRDDLVYHLALPRHFAVHGGFVPQDHNVFYWFPLGWESALALVHALGSPPDRFPPLNPRLLGALATVGTSLAVAGLAQAAGAPRARAAWGGALWLAVPTVLEFGASNYVEPWLGLATTLALTGVLLRWNPAFVGVLAGVAASTKYPGIMVAAFVAGAELTAGLAGPGILGPRRNQMATDAVRRTLTLGAAAGAVGGVFLVRNLVDTGNPVYPMAWERFGGPGWDAWRAEAYAITLIHYGAGRGPEDLLRLPWHLATWRDLHAGFQGSLGPVPVLGFVAAAVLATRTRGGVVLLGFATAWLLVWALSVQQIRFFLVAVPALLAALLAASPRGLAPGLVLAAVLWGALPGTTSPWGALWSRQDTTAWLSGAQSRDAWLAERLPESWEAWRGVEAHVPADRRVWLVWMRGYTWWLRREVREDMVFEAWRFEALLDEVVSPEHLKVALWEANVSHVLVNHRFFLVDDNADLEPGRTDRLRERFGRCVELGALEEVERWGPVALYAVGKPGLPQLRHKVGLE